MAWDLLSILTVSCLIWSFFRLAAATWAGLLFGSIMGVTAGAGSLVFARGFNFPMTKKAVIISVFYQCF